MSRPNVGSVFQRKDGRWCAVVTLNGKRVTRYAKSKSDARRRLQALLQAQGQGALSAPAVITAHEWLDQWLALREPEIRPSTYRSYRNALRAIEPFIGTARLDRVEPVGIAFALSEMRRRGLGERRIQLSYGVLKQAFGSAVRLRLLAMNPAERVDAPRHRERRRDYWTMGEVRRFLVGARADRSRYAPLFIFLLSTGLRISEASALVWSDVDLDHGTARVERALVFTSNRATLHSPKSRDGFRAVALPTAARDALRSLPQPHQDGAVFVNRNGRTPTPMDLRRSLQSLCARVGVPAISPHGLRHVNAALLAASGIVDPHTLRRHLGHSTIQMSLQRYAYAMKPDQVAADAFERAVGERL